MTHTIDCQRRRFLFILRLEQRLKTTITNQIWVHEEINNA